MSVCLRYGLRYTAKVLRDSLHEKFPQASEEELYKVSSLFPQAEMDVCEFCVVWSVTVGASMSPMCIRLLCLRFRFTCV